MAKRAPQMRLRGPSDGRRRGAALAAALLPLAAAPAVGAQSSVVFDGSFGAPGPAATAPLPGGGLDHQIPHTRGQQTGSLLFHSLESLSVAAGDAASLTGPAQIDHVFARVTGGSVSDIQGTFNSRIDSADVYLLNPSGVVFGRDSRVDVRGSFRASSADRLRFPGGGVFEARAGGAVPALAVDPPQAFGFDPGAGTPAGIALEGPELFVPQDQTFALVAGEIEVTGRNRATGPPTVNAPSGAIHLVAAGRGVEVPIDPAGLDPAALPDGALGDVVLRQAPKLQVNSPAANASRGTGTIAIRGGRFLMQEGGILDAIAQNPLAGSPIAIDVAASERVAIGGGAIVESVSVSGPSGDLRLTAPRVELSGAALVAVGTVVGAQAGPDLRLEAGELIVEGGAQLQTLSQLEVFPVGAGDGGLLHVDADLVQVRDGGLIQSAAFAEGHGGGIRIEAGEVRIEGSGQISTLADGAGHGGDVEIVGAAQLAVRDDGQLSSVSTATGDGGALRVTDAGDVSVTAGGRIASESRGGARGGDVRIDADGALRVGVDEAGAVSVGQVTTTVRLGASGRGGDVEIEAGSVRVSTPEGAGQVSQIAALTFSEANNPGEGAGGDLRLVADEVALLDGGQVRTTTEGRADAGRLELRARDTLRIAGTVQAGDPLATAPAGIFARTLENASGDGGDLVVGARRIELSNGGEISARTFGAGDAGDLTLEGADAGTRAEQLWVQGGPDGQATVSVRGDLGDGGNLQLRADRVDLVDGGVISASTLRSGDSGDLVVDADEIRVRGVHPGGASGIFAQTLSGRLDPAEAGDAGTVRLSATRSLRIEAGGRIAVESRGAGSGGTIEIHAPLLRLEESSITARSTGALPGSGNAGNIAIEAETVTARGGTIRTDAANAGGGRITLQGTRLVSLDGSQIATDVRGSGAAQDAGNIDIPAPAARDARQQPAFVVLNRSRITANAVVADAGDISIAADNYLQSTDSVVEASSELGIDGVIAIEAPNIEIVGQLAELPASFADVSALLTTPCAARSARAGSFVVQSREATPPPPGAVLARVDAGPHPSPECRSQEGTP